MASVLQLRPRLMPHQVQFVMDDKTPIQAFVGGYRSGKSVAGVWKSLRCAVELFPGELGVIMAPVTGMNQTNIVPILRDILPKTGLDYDEDRLFAERCYRLDIKVGNKMSSIYLDVSAENTKRMAGRSLAWGYFDEADVCRNADLAYEGFSQLKSRMSEAENPLIFATSTPEGYGFMYRKFVTEAYEDTRIWHVSTRDNFLLPKNYVRDQLRNIPANKHEAYINGAFSNITGSSVYSCFSREKNHTDLTIKDFGRHEAVHIGMDFNIDHMAGIVHCIKDNLPVAIDEICELRDVPTMIRAIQTKYPTRPIFVYPDASGKAREYTGLDTAHSLLRQAGFKVVVDKGNPGVGDRINSMNAMFLNAAGQRRYQVNTRTCPTYTRSLEQQAWVKGAPDKSNNVDHPLDAGGYFIHKLWPLKGKPTLTQH